MEPVTSSALARLRRSAEYRGIWRTLRLGLKMARPGLGASGVKVPAFDLEYGTETVAPAMGGNESKEARLHEPISAEEFEQQLRFLQASAGVYFPDFTFVDLGAGRGRAVMLASRFAFRAIVGVEFSGELYRAARQNLELYARSRYRARACTRLRIEQGDVTRWSLPLTPSVYYCYEPFSELATMARMVEQIRGSLRGTPRAAWAVYAGDRYRPAWEAAGGGFETAGDVDYARIYRWVG